MYFYKIILKKIFLLAFKVNHSKKKEDYFNIKKLVEKNKENL